MTEQKTKFYARNTIVKVIELDIAQDFVQKNHHQGSTNTLTSVVNLGMFEKNKNNTNNKLNDRLIAVAQFCSPRTPAKKRKYSTELLRLAFKKNVRVVGGASKLIKHYIKAYDPADIFTYQDTTGENTKVYEYCGFTLVSQDRIKKYLVSDGKSIKTSQPNEIIGVPYAVRYGPDRILGTKLGEVFHSNGVRKTNIELFKDLGWHIETTTGDKIYEWTNLNRTYYTYKITAEGSDKYYYGVSHVKIANASEKDCLEHNYYGSGGNHSENNKFNNWKKKYKKSLKKEIIDTFDRKTRAFKSEKNLIGDLWKTDPSCLNSMSGGHYTGLGSVVNSRISMKVCSIHGETKHHNNKCSTCIVENAISVKTCEIHGSTKHYGDSCNQCRSEKSITLKKCEIHGETKYIGNKCYKCRKSSHIVGNCEIHGKTSFQSGKCLKCSSIELTTMKNCSVHGLTKHRGNVCALCRSQNSIGMKDCSIHGLTKHRGKSCSKCTADKAAHHHHSEEKGKTKENCSLCQKEIQEGTRQALFKKEKLLNVCQLCENEFEAKSKRQLFCSNPHLWNCVSCNVEITPVPRKDKKFYACRNRSCINEATRLSNLENYGVENVSHIDSVKAKISVSKM